MQQFTVVFSPAAVEDLASIRAHIASANGSSVADSFVGRLIAYCENVTTGLISQWEHGEKHPRGAALKPVAKRGLQMVA